MMRLWVKTNGINLAIKPQTGAADHRCFVWDCGVLFGSGNRFMAMVNQYPAAQSQAEGGEQAASAAACQLCGRVQLPLTRHHLIPQSRHNKTRTQRQFDRVDMQQSIALLCRPCHSQVHAVLDNISLATAFYRLDLLAAHPEIARFSAWIRSKPAGLKVSIRRPKP
jgi:hypothetical protein